MKTKRLMKSIEWTEKRLEQNRITIKAVEQARAEYLQWMAAQGYCEASKQNYKDQLNQFVGFIEKKHLLWDEIFTLQTLNQFKKTHALDQAHGIRGLGRYLFAQKRITQPIARKDYDLPVIYEDYLRYYQISRQASWRRIKHIKRVLAAFDHYLKRQKVKLAHLRIGHIDDFLSEFNAPFAPATCRLYRSYVRGFLKYLYYEWNLLRTDLSALIRGAPVFTNAKPPKFLRPREIEKLFATLSLSSPKDIRTCAMVHLAYTLGLRPQEISRITLNDISFTTAELKLKDRKGGIPLILPLPDTTIKAIAAYLIGARPQSKERTLFLALTAPHGPLVPLMVGHYIRRALSSVNPAATAYWLRHTYAQNLLEAGASIYEIKEMLGHDHIESTRKYLHIHIKLMRKVLFDEEEL